MSNPQMHEQLASQGTQPVSVDAASDEQLPDDGSGAAAAASMHEDLATAGCQDMSGFGSDVSES
jgi:hypothetical protein